MLETSNSARKYQMKMRNIDVRVIANFNVRKLTRNSCFEKKKKKGTTSIAFELYRSTCIDLFLTNSPHSFQNTMTISTGLSDFHKMIITVLKSSFIKLKAKEMYCGDYKECQYQFFQGKLTLSLDRINKGFDSFEYTFMKTLNRHAPMKKNLSEQMRYLI